MTDLTDEAVKALLDGAYPGPYAIEGRAGQLELMDAKGHIFGCVEWSFGGGARDSATADLLIAAPDLARALLAARADTEAAVALALEEAVDAVPQDPPYDARSAIRALAPASGVARLAELRAERDDFADQVASLLPAVNREAVEQRVRADTLAAEVARLRERERRRLFPILKGEGAQIDYQLVADHAEQARSNHYQSVDRLAERGGLSWCELYAVLHNRKWEKIDTNEAMIACRALEARYLAALATDSDAALSAAQPVGMAGEGV